jgi:sulfur carrier protein
MTECQILLNGEKSSCPAGLKLPELLQWLGYKPQLVVVEYNEELLVRSCWADQLIKAGDRLEVVTIVGGG